MRHQPALHVNFNYRRLQKDVERAGFKATDLRLLFKEYCGADIALCSIYAWFQRGCIPLGRLTELLTIVRVTTGKRLDLWRYIDVPQPKKRAA
jgi:hypothetical protein